MKLLISLIVAFWWLPSFAANPPWSALAWTNDGTFIYPTHYPAFVDGSTHPGPPITIRRDGSIYCGTNVNQDVPPNDYSIWKFAATTMVNSNEAPSMILELDALDDQNYDWYATTAIKADVSLQSATFGALNIEGQSDTGYDYFASIYAGANKNFLEFKTNGVFVGKWETNGVITATKYVGQGSTTNFTTYATGTAYTLTGSSAALTFGTTQPVLTINQAGTYLIQGNVGIKYSGATYAGAQTITLKFRRTNNTAADLSNGSRAVELPVLTTFTGGDVMAMPPVIYTATAGDTVTIFGILSATPAAGSVLADSAELVCIRLY